MSARDIFPIELVEKIIFEAWSSPLSIDDRISFMTSSRLVNTVWKALFSRICYRDVYIPCVSYLRHYVKNTMRIRLNLENFSSDNQDRPCLDELCQSITFRIKNPDGYPYSILSEDEPQMGNALPDFLSLLTCTIGGSPYFPNLHTLSVEYEDMGFDDIFTHQRFIFLPPQVTNLELTFMFDERTPSWLPEALRESHQRQPCLSLSLPSVRHISLAGASKALVMDIAACCPYAETISVTDCLWMQQLCKSSELSSPSRMVAKRRRNLPRAPHPSRAQA